MARVLTVIGFFSVFSKTVFERISPLYLYCFSLVCLYVRQIVYRNRLRTIFKYSRTKEGRTWLNEKLLANELPRSKLRGIKIGYPL